MRKLAAAVLAGLLVLAGAPTSVLAGCAQPRGVECDMACCKRPGGGGMGGHAMMRAGSMGAASSRGAAGSPAAHAADSADSDNGSGRPARSGIGGSAGATGTANSVLCGWSCGKRRSAGASVEVMPSLLPAPPRLAAPYRTAGTRPGLETLSSLPPADRPERPPRA
jgi:hypothetical protein